MGGDNQRPVEILRWLSPDRSAGLRLERQGSVRERRVPVPGQRCLMALFRKLTEADKRRPRKSRHSRIMPHSRVSNLSAGRIALGYAVIAILWIAFSDAVVTHFKLHPAVMTIKGTVFVFVTAWLLYFTIRRLVRAVQLTSQERDETAKLYRTVVEAINEGICLLDESKRISFLNGRLAAMLGRSAEELQGNRLQDFIEEPHVLAQGGAQQSETYECRLRKDSDRKPWLLISRHPVLNDAGEVVQLVCTATDITERKRAEEALRRSEAYLAESQRLTHTGSFAYIPGGAILYWSEESLRIWGFGQQQTILSHEMIRQRIHPDDRGRARERAEKAMGAKTGWYDEFRIVLPDGTVKHIHAIHHPVFSANGELVEVVGTHVDVTERKRAEEALRESETRFRTFVDHAGDALFVQDLEQGTIVDVNRQACESLGYTRQELIGNTAVAFHPDLDRAQMESVAGRAAAGETVFDTHWHRRKDGSTFPVEAHTSLFSYGGRRFLLNVARDISDRVRAEEKLRQDEMELRQIVDAVPQHIFVLEPDGRFLYVNRRDLEYSGLTLKDVHAADYLDRIWHPGDWERLGYDRAHAIAQGIPWEAEARLLGKDGQYRWFLIRLNPLRDEQGRIIRWYGTRTDIEDRKQAEEKVQQSEGELRQILNLTPQLVAVLEPDGRISYANEIMLQYTGLTLEDVRAEDFRSRVFHSDDVERVRDERQNALSRSVPFENEQRVLGKNGKYRWFFFRYNPLHDAQGRLIRWYASGTDVEDRKQAEERLQHENVVLREEIDKTSMFEEIVGTSAALQTVLSRVSKVAPTDSTVLLTGETGTGKELVARAIHRRSHRSSRAFVSVNCAAIPRDLIASELFGHEKGAFTGATQQRLGRFELAGGGTIFLDEVGELPAETQIALLRVLQEHEFERVGGTRSIQTNVRVIAATNRDLQAAIAAGAFRDDLFYRLNVFPIEIPPLRERKEDILLLVEYFVDH